MISCLIVDDEPLALDILENYIARLPNLALTKRCSSALEAFEFLQNDTVDMIFLDIHMPELTGIDFIKALARKPIVVFTTAYPNYALEGYNLDVLDYLLKPIAFDRFLKSVNKASLLLQERSGGPASGVAGTGAGSSSASQSGTENTGVEIDRESKFLFVKSDLKMVRVELNDILFVEGMKDYVKIQTLTERVITHHTMKKMAGILPTPQFMRIHKSYIVAVDQIKSMDGNLLEVGEHKISVSSSYKEELLSAINDRNLMK